MNGGQPLGHLANHVGRGGRAVRPHMLLAKEHRRIGAQIEGVAKRQGGVALRPQMSEHAPFA